jgi:LysM repeat protein
MLPGSLDEPPGWFRDEALSEGADAATEPAATVADGKAVPQAAAPLAAAVVPAAVSPAAIPAAAVAPVPITPAAIPPAATGEPEAADAADAADAPDESVEVGDLEPTPPGTIYRTVPPLPEDAAPRPHRRSPVVSVLLGLLILAVVGVGGFVIGMALPLLMPLPTGDTPIVSPAPSGAVPSATPVPSVATSPAPAASPSSPASAAPTPTAMARTYVVKRGDQLGRIAASFGITLQALQAANGIANPNLIFVGQKLVIPPPSASPGAPPGASPGASPSAAP